MSFQEVVHSGWIEETGVTKLQHSSEDPNGQLPESSQLGQGLKATRPQPARGLLMDDLPRRQIVGHAASRRADPDDVAQAVEDLA